MSEKFWETKTLDEMTLLEWESLCDGCAKCCLIRLEDEDTEEIACTNISCRLLDIETCRCQQYENRHEEVPQCLQFSKEMIQKLSWLPSTCAYRLLDEGKPLPHWHPLVSKDPNSVHEHHISVRGKIEPETSVSEEDLSQYIIDWMD